MRNGEGYRKVRFRIKGIHAVLAYAASLVLTGVPPEVCESVLDELICSVKSSIQRIAV